MNRKTAILLGAASALATGSAFAAPTSSQAAPVPVAASYAELLQPIPNAVERLRVADEQADLAPARLIDVQYWRNRHHHHHNHNRRWYQQNGYSWYNGSWVLRQRYNYNRHHHHHSHY